MGDTLSAGGLTINAGLRYDRQTSTALPSSAPAHALVPTTFPAVSFNGFDAGFAWRSVSPRLGLTYDLSGDARTLVRLNAARYYSPMPAHELAFPKITTCCRRMDFEWTDGNGNGSVDSGETGDLLFVTGGWDPANPNAESPNLVTETSPPVSDELIVGIEREIDPSLGVGANFVYRRNGNFTWDIREGEEDDAFWTPVTQEIAGFGPLEVYQPVGVRSNRNAYQQRHDYHTRYRGVELFLTKRFANGWMANASLNLGNNTQHFAGTRGYTDPTNVGATDGRTLAPVAGRLGTTHLGATWFFKSSAMYQFSDSGVSLAGFFQVRQGNLNPQLVRSNQRAFGAGRALAWIEPIGETRLGTYWNLDLRAEKTFDLYQRGRVHLIVDAFNLTNNDTALERFNQVNSPVHDRITEVVQGRTIRLGVRLLLR